MSNYVTINHKKGDFLHSCKFNVSEYMASVLIPELEKYFQLELLQGSITSKNMRERTRRVNVWEMSKQSLRTVYGWESKRLNHKVGGKGIEFKASDLKAQALKEAFLSQLQIFENQN